MRLDVERLLREVNPAWGLGELIPLAGDASARAYFRVKVDGHSEDLVLMVLGPSGGAEEYGADRREGDELPFLHVQRFMEGVGLPVPPIHAFCPVSRLMLLGDLGDVTLSAWVDAHSLAAALPLYERAMDHLATLQVQGTAALNADSQLARQIYRADVFEWEFHHFVEFGVEAERGPLSAAERAAALGAFARISEELAALPRVVVHRDYHSRNLMVVEGDVGIIDFQDAVVGPGAYDLVSLLNDAYVTLPEETVAHLVGRYRRAIVQAGGEPVADLERAFDLCALNRCLKAAGRFAYFKHNAGNTRYLGYVPTALANARRALHRQPDLAPLADALGRRVPELR